MSKGGRENESESEMFCPSVFKGVSEWIVYIYIFAHRGATLGAINSDGFGHELS